MSRHLDLGCGAMPRNPLTATQVWGLDIVKRAKTEHNFLQADLNISGIPAESDFFDSVSAYDFLEHILRVSTRESSTVFPFISLMNEIHRVLKHQGRFLAVTPLYPLEASFVDPTHVNFLTLNTHKYFCEPHCWAKMYGFVGKFRTNRVSRINFSTYVDTRPVVRTYIRKLLDTCKSSRRQHVLWDLSAIK